MKKTTSSKLSKKLAKYGALTAAIAGVADASGQIIYTDITPDFSGGIGSSTFLDLDNNGTNDFQIIHDGGDDLDIVPVNNANNNVLGSIGYSYSYYGSFYGYAYPFVLNNTAVISSANSWNNFGYNNIGVNSLNFGNCIDGNWCDITDGYLGLRFDIAGSTHYGWARLDVSQSGDIWVVKDYAYNSVANEAITAGEQSLSNNDALFNEQVRIVALNKTIGLYNLPQATSYQLFSIEGKVILNGTTQNEAHTINASTLSNGIYIIEVTNTETKATIRKKVII